MIFDSLILRILVYFPMIHGRLEDPTVLAMGRSPVLVRPEEAVTSESAPSQSQKHMELQ